MHVCTHILPLERFIQLLMEECDPILDDPQQMISILEEIK